MTMPLFGAGQRVTGAKLKALADGINAINAQLAPAWSTLTLQNGWTNRAGYAVAGYRKIIKDGSNLQLVLNITGGTTANNTTIGTLAAGFWPITIVQIPIATRIAATPQQIGVIEISIAGVIKIFDIGASTTIHMSGMVSLDR